MDFSKTIRQLTQKTQQAIEDTKAASGHGVNPKESSPVYRAVL